MKTKSLTDYRKRNKRPLILDGAIGSQLQMSGTKLHPHLWASFLNITDPQVIIKLHKEYIEAGADIITTNTFRTNPIAYDKSNLSISNFEFVNSSVELAKTASKYNDEIIIAGSNPPAEDSYQRERTLPYSNIVKNHQDHIEMLWESGVDFILNETQSQIDEIKIICEYCSKNSIPFIMSLLITEEHRIFSGESFSHIADLVLEHYPIAISVNCIFPKIYRKLFAEYSFNYPWGFYLNCGSSYYTDDQIVKGISPLDYIKMVFDNINENLLFVGLCCGSSSIHTKVLKDYFDSAKS